MKLTVLRGSKIIPYKIEEGEGREEVLWELHSLHHYVVRICFGCLQVIGAVGFMNQRLDIPKEVDSRWASIIESCWHRCLFSPCSVPAFTGIS